MEFTVEKKDNYALIEVQAEKLDSNIAPNLKSELVVLNAEGVKNIILNLTHTRYCDSSGLSSILVANRLCKNAQGKLVLCNLQDGVKKLIAISQLDSILSMATTIEEATTLI
ncbi:MAG: STAS domain-containing protein [Bacteroidia bacterium]|nr:STAS domain-containing protein [Bacteroidia bacterium]